MRSRRRTSHRRRQVLFNDICNMSTSRSTSSTRTRSSVRYSQLETRRGRTKTRTTFCQVLVGTILLCLVLYIFTRPSHDDDESSAHQYLSNSSHKTHGTEYILTLTSDLDAKKKDGAKPKTTLCRIPAIEADSRALEEVDVVPIIPCLDTPELNFTKLLDNGVQF